VFSDIEHGSRVIEPDNVGPDFCDRDRDTAGAAAELQDPVAGGSCLFGKVYVKRYVVPNDGAGCFGVVVIGLGDARVEVVVLVDDVPPTGNRDSFEHIRVGAPI
jgi:hypothetical protein